MNYEQTARSNIGLSNVCALLIPLSVGRMRPGAENADAKSNGVLETDDRFLSWMTFVFDLTK